MRLNRGENQGNKAGCPIFWSIYGLKIDNCSWSHPVDYFHNQHIKANLTKNQPQQSKRLKNDFQIVLPIVVIRARMQSKLLTPLSQFTILFKHWIRLWAILILNTQLLFQSIYGKQRFFIYLFCFFRIGRYWHFSHCSWTFHIYLTTYFKNIF